MSARSAYARRPGLVWGALRSLEDWLLEPESDASMPEPAAAAPDPQRVVVAVAGVRSGCGVSTVARALAARLAIADPDGAAVLIATDDQPLPPAIAGRQASRLRSSLHAAGIAGRAGGRLCTLRFSEPGRAAELARPHAPVVIDVPHAREARAAAAAADLVVIVAPGDAEPALAQAFAESRAGGPVLVVANRPRESERWAGRAAAMLPESRIAARLAGAGWPAGGSFGRAIGEIAEVCGALACA